MYGEYSFYPTVMFFGVKKFIVQDSVERPNSRVGNSVIPAQAGIYFPPFKNSPRGETITS